MLGLLWKDIFYVKKTGKKILWFVLFFVILGLTKRELLSQLNFVILIIGMNFSILPFDCDSKNKWEEYQYAFPVSKKTIVCSRYLFGIVTLLECFLINVLGILFYIGIKGNLLDINSILIQVSLICYIAVLQAITFPMMYLMEIGKARIYALFLSCLITWIVVGSVSSLFSAMLYQKGIVVSAGIMMGSTSICYVLSLLLSIHIEENKMQQ